MYSLNIDELATSSTFEFWQIGLILCRVAASGWIGISSCGLGGGTLCCWRWSERTFWLESWLWRLHGMRPGSRLWTDVRRCHLRSSGYCICRRCCQSKPGMQQIRNPFCVWSFCVLFLICSVWLNCELTIVETWSEPFYMPQLPYHRFQALKRLVRSASITRRHILSLFPWWDKPWWNLGRAELFWCLFAF